MGNKMINKNDLDSFCLQYFDEIRMINNDQLVSEAYWLNKIYVEYFSGMAPKNITPKYISKIIKDMNTSSTKRIMKFVFILNENGLIVNPHLSKVCELSCCFSMITKDKKEDFIRLLNSKDIDRFVVVPFENNTPELIEINIDNKELFDVAKDFILEYSKHGKTNTFRYSKYFWRNFSSPIEQKDKINLDNLNFSMFKEQLEYVDNLKISQYKRNLCLNMANQFYSYIAQNYNQDIFQDGNVKAMYIGQQRLPRIILDGYSIENYNPVENVPDSEMWMLCYSEQNVVNQDIKASFHYLFDFKKISNKTYRDWCKFYIWKDNTSLTSKMIVFHYIVIFLNYISDLKSGNIMSIYSSKTDDLNITVDEIASFKNFCKQNNKEYIIESYVIRAFLRMLNSNNVINVHAGIDQMLESYKVVSTNKKSIPDDELKRLINLMKEKSKDNIQNKLLYLAAFIAIETEFRMSQILSLKIDCIQETNKPNEYVLVSKTKTSKKDYVEQPITLYVKRHIEEIIGITNQYRSNIPSTSPLKNYIFVYQTNNTPHILRNYTINKLLKSYCDELQIPSYTFSNFRDVHMTKAEEFIIRNQLSDMQQNILSGHTSPTVDNKYYVDTNIKDMLEAVHGIIIGNVNINGKIVDSDTNVIREENGVSNGCGYCSSKSCNDFSMLDCLMCKHFVTTIDRLPYFEEQVKCINEKIERAEIPHDKEDLMNIKRLHVGFINEILKKGEHLNEK